MHECEITVSREDPHSVDAQILMAALSACLESITGSSGEHSFDVADVCGERSVFAVARDPTGKAVGCGAFRPMDEKTAEVKRMYAKVAASGIGSALLRFLEREAHKLGYTALRLETRVINTRAVAFYEHGGYRRIPNYGRYEKNKNCVCFEKVLL